MKRTVFIAAAVALVAAFFVGSHFYKSGRVEKLGFMAEDNAAVSYTHLTLPTR